MSPFVAKGKGSSVVVILALTAESVKESQIGLHSHVVVRRDWSMLMSFLNKFRKQPEPAIVEPEPVVPPTMPSKARGFIPPPPRPAIDLGEDPTIVRLEKRRQALEESIEQVVRGGDPDGPFQQRIAILGETLDSIQQEIQQAIPLPQRSLPTLPATPIEAIEITLDPVPDVQFRIGPAAFHYAEEIDWGERGTTIVRGYLKPVTVELEPVLPNEIAPPLRDELRTHLDRSLFAFATDLRDNAVEGKPAPAGVTLADLAKPCPKCGDWQLWGGICPNCLEHQNRLRQLNLERTRILDERAAELEERQRQVEELPMQRRKLAETNAALKQVRERA